MSAIHPDEATLLRWAAGELPERRQAALKRHVARCRSCRAGRESTRRLHERLSAAGDALAFAPGDPFAERPIPRDPAARPREAAKVMAGALARLEREKAALTAAIEEDASKAGKAWDLGDAARRLAAAHLLEEALGVSSSTKAAFARAIAARLAAAGASGVAGESEITKAVLPTARLLALAHLVAANRLLFEGKPEVAEGELAGAWHALADADAPEHLAAWAEVAESLRRSYLGRPVEGRLLAERALGTFERYGLAPGVLKARHARAVALYYGASYREAHREFRAALGTRDATGLDRARAVSGAAFCLVARGRFVEAAKEYSIVRRRLRGDSAVVEQYLLRVDMKLALGTAGRWSAGLTGRPVFALPEAGGAPSAKEIAAEIVKLASEEGIEAARLRIKVAEADPVRFYALLYVVQLAMPKVSGDPAMYVELAKAIQSATRSLPLPADKRPAPPVCREQVIGEAQLLEANALNFQGLPRESRATARAARESFVEAGDDNFALAIVDYYEGSAASFEKQWADARSLLRRSLDTFRLYGQENWAGRSEASLATLLQNKGQDESSLHFFDLALAHLDPETEGPAYGSAWVNKAFSLLLLRRLDAAKAAYAKGIALARRFDLKVSLFAIRYGLALIDLETGQTLKALNSFKRIAEDAAAAGFAHRVVSAELRVAECLGRLGQRGEMVTRVRALHRELPSIVVEYEAPLRELFADAENADVTSELVAHVVEYIEARERGVQKAYRPFRLVKGGK